MKKSIYKSYDELPLMLNAEMIKNVLGISLTSAYELMHEKDFPSIKIGSRLLVPKDKFILWIDRKAKGGTPWIICTGNKNCEISLWFQIILCSWIWVQRHWQYIFICCISRTEKRISAIQVTKPLGRL